MKYYYDIEQGTESWFDIRLGKFGASKAAELLMTSSTAGYNNLINEKVYQRITGEFPESYSNEWMTRGLELEDEALKAFEFSTFTKIKKVGYVEYDEFCGCSPDGLIEDDGLIQVKCPKFSTHIDYLLNKKVPGNYYKQCQYELFITDRKYNIFFSYHPKLKPVIFKLERDEKLISEIQIKLKQAIQLVNERIILLKS